MPVMAKNKQTIWESLMIRVDQISRSYGDFKAVDGVSFSINDGEIVGLLGHNGAGKTTIMKMLTGYLEPSGGTITIDDMTHIDRANDIQQLIGYLPENLPVYPEMMVMDYLFYCAEVRNIPEKSREQSVLDAIRKTDLGSKALKPIATLSRGFKQRVGVAQALIHNPKILILDEPTNGLDPHQTHQMRELIRSLSSHATVIISTHIMQEVDALCDRVVILDNGQLAVDQTLDELRRSENIALQTSADMKTVNAHLASFYLEHNIKEAPPAVSVSSSGTGNRYHLPVTRSVDIDKFCSWINTQLVNEKEQVFAIHPLMRDLETVFRDIHENKNKQYQDQSNTGVKDVA